jgi:hypothetical protein
MSDPTNQTATPCCPGLVRFGTASLAVLACGCLAWWFWPASTESVAENTAEATSVVEQSSGTETTVAPTSVSEPASAPPAAEEIDEDQRMSAAIVGKWQTEREVGHRDLTVNDDGTAQMIVNIESTMQKLIFGARMIIDIKWHIADGFLTFEMIGGEPKSSVDMLTKIGGTSLAFEILEINENRLLVKDTEDDPDHDWKRVEE